MFSLFFKTWPQKFNHLRYLIKCPCSHQSIRLYFMPWLWVCDSKEIGMSRNMPTRTILWWNSTILLNMSRRTLLHLRQKTFVWRKIKVAIKLSANRFWQGHPYDIKYPENTGNIFLWTQSTPAFSLLATLGDELFRSRRKMGVHTMSRKCQRRKNGLYRAILFSISWFL